MPSLVTLPPPLDALTLLAMARVGQGAGFANVQHMQALSGHVMAVTLGEVIHHGDVVPLLQKKVHSVRADVSGAAGD